MKKSSRNLLLAYITVFMDVMGNSIVVPILPYISQSMGGTAMQEGVLFSGYSLTQLLSI